MAEEYQIVDIYGKDGKLVESVEFPMSMSDAEISAIIRQQFGSQAGDTSQEPQEKPKSGIGTDLKNLGSSAVMGLSSLPRGAIQTGVDVVANLIRSERAPQGAEQQQLFQNALNQEFSRLKDEADKDGRFVPVDLLFKTAEKNVEKQGILNPVQGGIEGVRESLANTNQRMDERYQEMVEQSPVASRIGNYGSQILQGGAIGAGKNLTKGQIAGRGFGAGAVYGYLDPSSEQRTAEDAMDDRKYEGIIGGVVGGVAPSVIRGGAKAVTGSVKAATQPVRTLASKLANPQIAKEAEELGIKLGLDTQSDSWALRKARSLLKGTSASNKIQESSAKVINQIENAVEKLANRASPKSVNATDVGEGVIAGMKKKTSQFRENYGAKMNALNETYNIKDNDLIDTPNLKAALQNEVKGLNKTAIQDIIDNPAFQHAQKIVNSAKNNKVKPPSQVSKKAGMLGMDSPSQIAKQQGLQQNYDNALKNRLDYKSLKVLKKDFQNINYATVVGNQDNAIGKRLYAALAKDLEGYFAKKGEGALQAFKRNNKYYSEGMEQIAKITEKYNKKYNVDGIAKNLLSGTQNGTTELNRVFRNIDEGHKDIMRAYFLRSLGRNSQGEFQIGNFLSSYNKISDKGQKSARDILFGKAGTSYRKDLDKIAKLAKQLQLSKSLDNTSRSADNLGNILLYGMGYSSGGVLGLVGAYSTSRGLGSLITSKKFAKWLATHADKPLNANTLARAIQGLQNVATKNPEIATDITRLITLLSVLTTIE